MAQKVNSIAVRLNFNRFSDSSWFSDYYYSTLLYQDINIRQYLTSIKQPNANKLGFRVGKCIVHHFPKKSLIHLFCLSNLRAPSVARPGSGWNADKLFIVQTSTTPSNQRTRGGNPQEAAFVPGQGLMEPVYLTDSVQNRQNSLYWFKSSIAQKKKALINLYRGVVDNLLQKPIKTNVQLFLTPPIALGSTKARSLMLLKNFEETNNPPAARPEGEMHPSSFLGEGSLGSFREAGERPLTGLSTQKVEASNRTFNQEVLLEQKEAFDPVGRKRSRKARSFNLFQKNLRNASEVQWLWGNLGYSFFNLYALYYYFLQKTNNLYNKECFAMLKKIRKLKVPPSVPVDSIGTSSNRTLIALPRALFAIRSDKTERSEDRGATAKFSPLHTQSAKVTKSLNFYFSNILWSLSQTTNTFLTVQPIKVNSIYHCGSLIAQEIACKLEQKKSFRVICRHIFQQISSCKYIMGIRIHCSGRLNGAEIAKTECKKFGETSLHVFSTKIDYANTKASTPYGILGIKVWISYI